LADGRSRHHIDGEEVDPPRRIVWGGPAQGIVAFTSGPSTNKTTEFSFELRSRGKAILSPPSPRPCNPPLDGSLRAWLENLKRVAERAVGE
jgi:hypothetical protein